MILGILVRFLFINTSGTFDFIYFCNFIEAIKDFNNVSFLYYPGIDNILNWKAYNLPVMYPPGFLYIFFLFNKLNILIFNFDTKILVKIIIIFFEFLTYLILFFSFKNRVILISIFFWINPLIILSGTMLGYVESIFIFFLIASLILIKNKRYLSAVIFFIISCSVKQLALVLMPIYLIYYLKINKFITNSIFFIIICILIVIGLMPLVLYSENYTFSETILGFIKNMYWSVIQNYISANGLNFWWLYSSFLDLFNNWNISYSFIENLISLNFKYLKVAKEAGNWGFESSVSRIFVLSLTLLNILTVLKRPTKLVFFTALIFQYFSYVVFATGVHENHGVLLAILASFLFIIIEKKNIYFAIILNFYSFINLWMFYGFFGLNNFRLHYLWQLLSLVISVLFILLFINKYIKFIKKNLI